MQTRSPQKRRTVTRNSLIAAASDIVAENGFGALRVEDVVARAQVAKGTFFAHFEDKDRLMALLIGQEMDVVLQEIDDAPPPQTITDLAQAIVPLMDYIGQDRIVFDVVLRFSGAAAIETTEKISVNFLKQVHLYARWLVAMPPDQIRGDVDPGLLAEGIQAFMIQVIALRFCALHNSVSTTDRLLPYLVAWLGPVRSPQ